MIIRKAEKKDIGGILKLLSQVLELHAEIRSDIFVSGKTKYSKKELEKILGENNRITLVAIEDNNVLGYAFCILEETADSDYLVAQRILFVDDLCVDEKLRGHGIGKALFESVKEIAKNLECYEITLNVWEGNSSAKAFYSKLGMKPKKTVLELIL